MPDKPGELLQKLTHNQFSQITVGALIESLNKAVPASWKLLNINVERYKQIPQIASSLPTNSELNTVYQALNEIFPTFPFITASQLKSQPNYTEVGHQFQIAAIGSTIAQYTLQKSHLTLFLKNGLST